MKFFISTSLLLLATVSDCFSGAGGNQTGGGNGTAGGNQTIRWSVPLNNNYPKGVLMFGGGNGTGGGGNGTAGGTWVYPTPSGGGITLLRPAVGLSYRDMRLMLRGGAVVQLSGTATSGANGAMVPAAQTTPGWWTTYYTTLGGRPTGGGNGTAGGGNGTAGGGNGTAGISPWLISQTLRGATRFALNNGYAKGLGGGNSTIGGNGTIPNIPVIPPPGGGGTTPPGGGTTPSPGGGGTGTPVPVP